MSEEAAESNRDIRPIVASPPSRFLPWMFGVALLLFSIWLFVSLEMRRTELKSPATKLTRADQQALARSPPPLFIPPIPVEMPPPAEIVPAPSPAAPEALQRPAPPPLQSTVIQPTVAVDPLPPLSVAPQSGRQSNVLVIDQSGLPGQTGETAPTERPDDEQRNGVGAPTQTASRVRATRLRHRETTIMQGTLIPAVLETALDSTRPGQARALVIEDVRGYGGKNILVPRGSRLFGEYQADLAPGQNRALVQWTRLDRPDGVTVPIASPAADPLGRAGIRGRVNSHFFERFGAAILQSSLDLGVSVAARSIGNGPVVVAVPGGALGQNVVQPQQIQRTLTVRQGTRISVFVARDLDFTAVERTR